MEEDPSNVEQGTSQMDCRVKVRVVEKGTRLRTNRVSYDTVKWIIGTKNQNTGGEEGVRTTDEMESVSKDVIMGSFDIIGH